MEKKVIKKAKKKKPIKQIDWNEVSKAVKKLEIKNKVEEMRYLVNRLYQLVNS